MKYPERNLKYRTYTKRIIKFFQKNIARNLTDGRCTVLLGRATEHLMLAILPNWFNEIPIKSQ